jgi:hypothetical protein
MAKNAENMPFLDHILPVPNTDLPSKSTELIPRVVLINIFPTRNVSYYRSSVWALVVLKLYDHLYDRIMHVG